MKQKRKVKSLIPLKSGSNVFLTTLLFLLGGILCFGAVRLFTSSMGVEAADAGSIEYPGIADKHEVLLKFGLIPKGGDTPLNEMYLIGTTFVVSGDNGISVNIGNSNDLDKYVNYLGGDGGMNISSDNITIIGGSADEIYQNNDAATVLGGMHNKVDEGNNKASPVLLGGEGRNDAGYKTIGKNQEGSAVVGGQNNEIKDNGSYDFILGGENNKIDGSNVIVGGSRVNVDEKSNVFAFSHGDSPFEPESENAFYLNLKNGLGLNRTAVNDGVDSNGAVSFGEVNIVTQKCTSADKGVQGTWQGCLVGCTETSAALSPSKWEMIDHGTGCEKICENNSSYCMINPIKIEVNSNPSYCTNIGVDTGHSHHCGGEENILPTYKDVLFETVLIDSDAKCPDPADPNNWTENRCVFKCDGGYHLTGGADGRARCYKDCELVWDHSTIKHNETVTAYKRTDANCSYNSDSQKGPYTCKNYKATLVCDDGTLKVKQSFASSSENGKDAYDLGYQYNECMLHQYRCPATYNYNKSQIDSVFKDAPANGRWNIQNRQKIVGTRGQYKLCVDYDAVTRNTVQYLNGENCFERDKNADNSYNLHYQWLGCNDHYHTGSRSNYVCMKDCTLKNPNGTTKYYLHETRITGYKNGSVDCGSAGNGKCESETLVCNDGKWRKGSLNGAITEDYKYNDCSLNDFNCSLTEYNVDESTKTAHQGESVYASSCISYDGQDDKVTCSKRRTDYKLTNCVGGHSTYHTENNRRCISNEGERQCTNAGATVSHHFHYINALVPVRWSGTAYNNGTWSTPANCSWKCDTNYHEDEEEGDCISNSRNVDCSDYYTLPANASWNGQGYQTWNTTRSRWNDPIYCSWSCIGGWHENAAGTACEKDCTVVSCSAYTLDECPYKGVCSYCTKVNSSCDDGETKAKLDYCEGDYEVSSDGTSCEYNPSCTANYCSAYGLDDCPEGGNCSWCTIKYTDCTNGDQKARLDSCGDGYNKVGDTCVPISPNPDDGGDDGGDDGDASACDGPCGSADDGESLTCYKPGVQCTSTTTTAPSQTRSCNGGNWSSSFNSAYTDSTPNLSSKTCSSSTYPLTTEPNAANGTKTSCTPYSQDGTKNACKAGTTRYNLTCNEGYELSNDGLSCQPIGGIRPGGEEDPEDCGAKTHTYGSCSFSIPALSDGASTTETYTTSPSYYGTTTAKCTNGTLSYSSESCITVCNSSTNPGSCNGSFSASGYPGSTWRSSYDYTCKYGTLSYSCSATCADNTYWKGVNQGCTAGSTICGSTHDNCVSPASFVNGSASSTTSSLTTTYTWKCQRGDYTEECSETKQSCPSGYWELWTSNTVAEIIEHECGQSGTDGWELQYNGTANGNSCVKCRAKSCPTGSSTTCNGAQVGFAGDSACYKCEETKNYTIVNGTSIREYSSWYLCTRNIGYISKDAYIASTGLPLSEQEACAGYDPNSHEDCYHDYFTSYIGDEQIFSCVSTSISSCGTTDYQQYCNSNPGGMCYISNTEDSCTEANVCYNTSMCGGNCGASPHGSCYSEKTCKGSMQYVQCK